MRRFGSALLSFGKSNLPKVGSVFGSAAKSFGSAI